MSLAIETEQSGTSPQRIYVHWNGVFAGALIAAAISFVLISFGSAIGLAVAPLAPSWRPTSALFSVLSGLWILAITIGAMAAGGYVVGRIRSTWHVTHTDELEFRDGLHGLVVWALAVSLGGALSGLAAMSIVAGAGLNSNNGVDATGAYNGVSAYQIDRLLRPVAEPAIIPGAQTREEAGRLLKAAVGAPTTDDSDRFRLAQLVRTSTGLVAAGAEDRVRQSILAAKSNAAAARHAAVLLAFITAASLVAGAATSWEAARIGGRHRDSAAPPSMAWRRAGR